MPTVADMMKVQQSAPDIFNTLQQLTKDADKFDEYIARMYRNFIYVRHDNGRIYQMNINEDPDGRPSVIIPSADVTVTSCVCSVTSMRSINKNTNQKYLRMSQFSSIRECLYSSADEFNSLDECLHIEMFRNI